MFASSEHTPDDRESQEESGVGNVPAPPLWVSRPPQHTRIKRARAEYTTSRLPEAAN